MPRSTFAGKLDEFLVWIYGYHGSLDSPEGVDEQVWGIRGKESICPQFIHPVRRHP